ncbi:MAG: ArsR family transcriptional regulator [Caldilineaceae bacterium]
MLAHTEMCVGDPALALEMSQPVISYQLRILRAPSHRGAQGGKHAFARH